MKGVHSLDDQQFGYAAPLLDLAAGSVLCCLGDHYSVLFQLFARGVTAMPRGLHARLCHAFLV